MFAEWVNARLPSEAEWEYACRARTRSTFTTGECVGSEQANFNWHENYVGAPTNGEAWLDGGDPAVRVVRGGSWYSNMKTLRSAYRHFTPPDYSSGYTGIRLVRATLE